MRAIRAVCLLVVLGILGPASALAQQSSQPSAEPAPAAATEPSAAPAAPQPEGQVQPVVPQPSQPATTSPALNFSQPSAQTDKDESLVEKWWFWTAIGAVVVGTVLAIVLVDSGSSTPKTTLGNQEFKP